MLVIVECLEAPEAVQYVVVRVVNLSGEWSEGQRTTTFDEGGDFVSVLQVSRGEKARLILILAEVAFYGKVFSAPPEC